MEPNTKGILELQSCSKEKQIPFLAYSIGKWRNINYFCWTTNLLKINEEKQRLCDDKKQPFNVEETQAIDSKTLHRSCVSMKYMVHCEQFILNGRNL